MNINTEQLKAMLTGTKARKAAVITVAAIIAVAVVALILKFTGIFDKIEDSVARKKLDETIDKEISWGAVSLSDMQARDLADKLYAAMKGIGTDEDAIYEVFEQMNTRSDVYAVIKTFSVKEGRTLIEWLTSELNSSERENVNKILQTNNVNYKL